MPVRKSKIGIIGCGGIAGAHINGYARNNNVELVAFCDVKGDNARQRAHRLNARSYTDYKKMIEEENLDGVSICTFPSTHKEIAIEALNKGVNVLCEKPLAVSTNEAKEMVEAARNNRVLLMTAFKFRFFDEVLTARQLISQGEIGKIIMFRNMFGGAADMSKKWFSKKEISGGGVLIDNGVHAIDLFRFLSGEVRNVSARVATFVQDIEVEDTARVLIEMENGALGSIDLSWSIPIPQDLYLEIYGSEGSIMVGLNNVRYRTERSGKWVEVRKNKESLDPFSKEVNHFVECIQRKESPIVDGVDGLRAMEVIEAVYESANQKTWIKVKLTKI